MEKLAQERGLLNKLREKTDISGRILESLNSEFASMMEKLRSTDERIRSHAQNVKGNVRAAKSLVARRDYLSAATNISAFHEKCRIISAELQKFIGGVDLKHYKFLLDQFDDEQKQQLFGYNPEQEIKLEDGEVSNVDDKMIMASLEKQAAWFNSTDPLADLANNLTSSRSHAMRALEKRFSISFLKELKGNTNVMVIKSQHFLQALLTIFKKLGTALAKRNVNYYIEAAKIFISKFAAYHQLFVKYYEKSILPLKQQHEKLLQMVEEEKARKLEEEAAKQRKEIVQPYFPKPAPPKSTLPIPPPKAPLPPKSEKLMYQPSNLTDLLNEEPEEEQPFDLTKRKSAKQFIVVIEKLAKENDHKSLMLEVLAFSEALEDTDQDASLKLLAIAEGMVEDYKTAGIFDFSKPYKKPEMQEGKPHPLL
jgi:hypothetical protein